MARGREELQGGDGCQVAARSGKKGGRNGNGEERWQDGRLRCSLTGQLRLEGC